MYSYKEAFQIVSCVLEKEYEGAAQFIILFDTKEFLICTFGYKEHSITGGSGRGIAFNKLTGTLYNGHYMSVQRLSSYDEMELNQIIKGKTRKERTLEDLQEIPYKVVPSTLIQNLYFLKNKVLSNFDKEEYQIFGIISPSNDFIFTLKDLQKHQPITCPTCDKITIWYHKEHKKWQCNREECYVEE